MYSYIEFSCTRVSQVVLSGSCAGQHGICEIGWRFDIPISTNVVQIVATSMVSALVGLRTTRDLAFLRLREFT